MVLNEADSAREFLRLFAPLRDALYRYARRCAWQEDQAADIVQEAAMTAWRKFRRFEPGTNFRAWMYKIVTNTVYRFNSRVGRSREINRLDDQPDPEALLERESAWSSILENPERVMESLDERMVRALDGLSPDERQCLLLRLLESFSYKEIAAMLDIPMGTVMSHVHRGRMKLRERLADLALEAGVIREGTL